MRLLPQSLFGRLVLVLLGGLILAQLATGYINLAERGELLYQAGGMRLAERIADIGKLLDSLPSAERRRVVAVFNAPPLTIAGPAPMAAARSRRKPICGFPCSGPCCAMRSATRCDQDDPARGRTGKPAAARPVRPARHAHDAASDGRIRHARFSPMGAFFTVQIALRDDTWVSFDTMLSPQANAIPLRVATLLLIAGHVIVLYAGRRALGDRTAVRACERR